MIGYNKGPAVATVIISMQTIVMADKILILVAKDIDKTVTSFTRWLVSIRLKG